VVYRTVLSVSIPNTRKVISTERKIPGRREVSLLIQRERRLMMPRGRLTKVDMLAKVNNIYNELDHEGGLSENKEMTRKYLRKVFEAIEEFRV
tara:strand:+ start:74 stop:352 length:279 start_codon:yes stop_codon:yes gene_type:complete